MQTKGSAQTGEIKMRGSCPLLAYGLVLLAGCSHHDQGASAPVAVPDANQVPYGWHADALKAALDADTGDKKPYTCFLDFGFPTPPAPSVAVTIPGLIERVDASHEKVQASSPELAQKAIHEAVFIGTVDDCEAPMTLRTVDASFPANRYPSLTLDAFSALANYYAAGGSSIAYEQEAQDYDPASGQTSDPFKQRDLLPAFKSKLDQAVATAKSNSGHVRVSFVAAVGHYDLNAHTFTFNLPLDSKTRITLDDHNGMHVNHSVVITFTDSSKFNSVEVADESRAKMIEQAVTKGFGQVDVDVDGQVVGTQAKAGGQRMLIVAPIALHATSAVLSGPHTPLFDIPGGTP
jgi:hypothetical protein